MPTLLSRLVFNAHKIFPGHLNKVYRQYSVSLLQGPRAHAGKSAKSSLYFNLCYSLPFSIYISFTGFLYRFRCSFTGSLKRFTWCLQPPFLIPMLFAVSWQPPRMKVTCHLRVSWFNVCTSWCHNYYVNEIEIYRDEFNIKRWKVFVGLQSIFIKICPGLKRYWDSNSLW